MPVHGRVRDPSATRPDTRRPSPHDTAEGAREEEEPSQVDDGDAVEPVDAAPVRPWGPVKRHTTTALAAAKPFTRAASAAEARGVYKQASPSEAVLRRAAWRVVP